jgi:hypothetical protein
LARGSFDRAFSAQKTRSAELCNPRYQRRAPVLAVAAARLTNTRLVPSGELRASTAAKSASAGFSCRGGRTFSVRSRAHSGPTFDVSSPAAFRLLPRCGRRFPRGRSRSLPPTATLNGSGFPDPRRLPSTRNRAGSSRSQPPFFVWDSAIDHDALSPIADSPLRARPCPPLSAATENGFLGQAPLADFCNHVREHGHTERPTIPRTKLAVSALFAAPAGYRDCERHGTGKLF